MENFSNQNYLYDTFFKASLRQGSASTKTKGEVSGGGAKPYKQKGTGHARRGSNRTPLRRGGGVIFGPKPRSYVKKMNAKLLIKVYFELFSFLSGNIYVIEDLSQLGEKTSVVSRHLKDFSQGEASILFVIDINDYEALDSVRNLSFVKFVDFSYLDVSSLLRHKKIVITRTVLDIFLKKVSNYDN